jgi:hypothetical protein
MKDIFAFYQHCFLTTFERDEKEKAFQQHQKRKHVAIKSIQTLHYMLLL